MVVIVLKNSVIRVSIRSVLTKRRDGTEQTSGRRPVHTKRRDGTKQFGSLASFRVNTAIRHDQLTAFSASDCGLHTG